MRRLALLFSLILLAACNTGRNQGDLAPVSPSTPALTPPPAHAPEIRFALIGELKPVNVWELFDETGGSYVDYAVRSEDWPRLYHLAPPELTFQPLAAQEMPSAVTQEGELFMATVKLREDLSWTDGSPFTAEDAAFTVNTALDFELGFDWGAYYSREYLQRAEASNPAEIRFVFDQQPNVGVWQYGALQGPLVQKKFWEASVLEASALLPDEALRADIDFARAYLANMQRSVDQLTAQVSSLRLNGQENRQLEGELGKRSAELTYAQNNLNKLLEQYESALAAARAALYAATDDGEPTLGTWMPAVRNGEAWLKEANPSEPFMRPNYDRAAYRFYADEATAVEALENGEVHAVLAPNGLTEALVLSRLEANPSLSLFRNRSLSEHVIMINPSKTSLADPAFRQAFFCAIDRLTLAGAAIANPLELFIPQGNGNWVNKEAKVACGDEPGRMGAVNVLKSAGYAWTREPTAEAGGEGLILPDGNPFPEITLLAPSESIDALAAQASRSIEQNLRDIGVPLTVEIVEARDIRYEVFSSKQYDLALLGWRASLYPGYLCGWFGPGGQLDYGSVDLESACGALQIESELDAAHQHLWVIQSILARELPFIPLYAGIAYDAMRGIRFPFETSLGGFTGMYGAPAYAIPVQ
ncbi:MAG: hypothetical protein FJZ87_15845 [Chloroflexi bacterium]|nr:hypothetical protein [Chloroflexota bacterium]